MTIDIIPQAPVRTVAGVKGEASGSMKRELLAHRKCVTETDVVPAQRAAVQACLVHGPWLVGPDWEQSSCSWFCKT